MKKTLTLLFAVSLMVLSADTADAQATKPNILVIMTDDVGIWNIRAYHRGMMGGSTPDIDRIADEGALFTDYYARSPAPRAVRRSSSGRTRSEVHEP